MSASCTFHEEHGSLTTVSLFTVDAVRKSHEFNVIGCSRNAVVLGIFG